MGEGHNWTFPTWWEHIYQGMVEVGKWIACSTKHVRSFWCKYYSSSLLLNFAKLRHLNDMLLELKMQEVLDKPGTLTMASEAQFFIQAIAQIKS